MGLFLAARLYRAGRAIGLLDYRPERAQRLHEIILRAGHQSHHATITTDTNPAIVATYPYILICVKAHATPHVAQALTPHVRSDACVLTLQNGLGNKEALACLPCINNLRIGITSYGAYLEDEKTVRSTGGGKILIGSSQHDTVGLSWQDMFHRAHLQVELVNNVDAMLWKKLILNAALNPVTALFGLRNGELLTHPAAWQTSMAILQESVVVARSLGLNMNDDELQQELLNICQATRENRSSMLVDIQAGRTTEIEAINGAIIRAAAKNNLSTPHNKTIMEAVLAQQSRTV